MAKLPVPFLPKTISVKLDQSTWPSKTLPPQLRTASGHESIDVGRALHMLGTITMPNLLSPASPALFWGWLRYYLSFTTNSDLRITTDFSALDPHQKGILSDDFGVAIATQWMVDRFGTFTNIVDGRRFANQFSRLLRKKHKSKAKVGMSKAPDFVMRDLHGKWHVLECKGTQSLGYQSQALKTAKIQKQCIDIRGTIRGEQLASSLYIASEGNSLQTSLKVIDPADEYPLLKLTNNQASSMELAATRLTVAQAFGSIGLNELAVEMTLPADIDPKNELLLPNEAFRLRFPRAMRAARAREQARKRTLTTFTHNHVKFECARRWNSWPLERRRFAAAAE